MENSHWPYPSVLVGGVQCGNGAARPRLVQTQCCCPHRDVGCRAIDSGVRGLYTHFQFSSEYRDGGRITNPLHPRGERGEGKRNADTLTLPRAVQGLLFSLIPYLPTYAGRLQPGCASRRFARAGLRQTAGGRRSAAAASGRACFLPPSTQRSRLRRASASSMRRPSISATPSTYDRTTPRPTQNWVS